MKKCCLRALLFLAALSPLAPAQTLQDEVVAELQKGAQAWNRADLETFMQGYAETLTYTAGGRIVRGSEALKRRYQTTYGSAPETMGKLAFEDIEVWPLGNDHALALGRWTVEFSNRKPGAQGIFSLVLQKSPTGWKIVHDHTSRLEETKAVEPSHNKKP